MNLDEDAACKGMPQHYFFLDGNGVTKQARQQIALATCARCPVIEECRAAAKKYEKNKPRGLRHGIWAGLTPTQRLTEDRNEEKTRRNQP